jgi:hypothetical protein
VNPMRTPFTYSQAKWYIRQTKHIWSKNK